MGSHRRTRKKQTRTSIRRNMRKRKRTSLSSSSRKNRRFRSKVRINRAPLLIMWVAIVAEREGYTFYEGLTFGKAVAALYGQARGRSLGIFRSAKRILPSKRSPPGVIKCSVMGMKLPGKLIDGKIHAYKSGMEISPYVVFNYLKRSFGSDLMRVKAALRKLAKRYARHEIGRHAYELYEKFRPRVPEGLQGWGAKGNLDLNLVKKLANKKLGNKRRR